VQAWARRWTPALWQDTLDHQPDRELWNTMVACAPHLNRRRGRRGDYLPRASRAGIQRGPAVAWPVTFAAKTHGGGRA